MKIANDTKDVQIEADLAAKASGMNKYLYLDDLLGLSTFVCSI